MTVYLDIVQLPRSQRLAANIPYDGGRGPDFAKRIDGAKWDKNLKRWTYPLEINTARRLREVFGKSLSMSDAVLAWGHAAKAAEAELLAAHDIDMTVSMEMPEVQRIAPGMHAAMMERGYQTLVPHFARLAGNYLNADQPGLGKTIETFASLLETGVSGHILVISPKTSLRATWEHEVNKWLGEAGAVAYVLDGTAAQRNARLEQALEDEDNPYVFVLVNPEMVRLKEEHDCPEVNNDGDPCRDREFCPNPKQHKVTRVSNFPLLFDVEWDAIVGDEVHRVLMHANPRAKQKSQVGLGFQRLSSERKIALSGTPMRGKPRLLWPTFHWLRPDLYSGQWRWSKFYFQTEDDAYATSGEKVTDNLRPEREERFNAELGRMMIRRTKQELRALNPAWAPPDKRYVEVWLDLDPKQEKAYKQMEKSAAAALSGGTLMANGVLAEMTRLRQFANSAGRMDGDTFRPTLPSNKIDWLLDSFLADRGIYGVGNAMEDGKGKVIIASQFTQFINLIAACLNDRKIDHVVLTGETNKGDYFQRAQQMFQREDGPRVALLNTMAGGVSITLDRADDLVIMDETWVPDDQEQVEDRAHRTSRTDHQVTIYYVRSEGTIERELAGTNEMKDDRQKRSLDLRRGIQVAKQKWNVNTKEKA
jgi:SNF2 family DNA or RNA helicase